MEGKKRKVIIIGTLPPPYSGYETATEVLMSCGLDSYYNLKLLNTRTTRDPSSRGKWNNANIISTIKVIYHLIKELSKFRPDISLIPLAQNKSGFIKWFSFAIFCKIFNVKIISRLGGDSFNKFYEKENIIIKIFIKIGLKFPKKIIVRGESLKIQFEGLVNDKKIMVVPNGFDIKKWEDALKEKKNTNKIRVLYIGQVSKAKGVFDILNVALELKIEDELDEYEFIFAGPIIEKERNILHVDNPKSTSKLIDKYLNKYKVDSEYIKFVGEVSYEEKIRLFESADILVQCSYAEGFPYVVLEAFASGVAVICSRVGGLRDWLEDYNEVLFVKPGDKEEIKRKIIELKNEKLRCRLNENAIQYLNKTHNLNVFKENMKNIIEKVINK